ncbi:class I glutamine amidotransferase-like protein [Hyaloscypha variabilis F]|uniref:Class I glutamine amidotransferase-like protein n=1 Tax=Hyaloscypha variabilis (strain UAMH 11265 / GT02V1 / F) TaxID=1149755 RepID=A0A2J6R0P8_HYAVF|nr:class I glutamine amidotransferase-like protein [Hyaloscypha variabilis F]
MQSFATTLVLYISVIAALLQNVIAAVSSQAPSNATAEQLENQKRSFSIGYVVFPGWEPLDVFGPLEILFEMSFYYKMTLAVIAKEVGPVATVPPPHNIGGPSGPHMDVGFLLGPTITATHTFENAPALDILIVPGGEGVVALEEANDTSAEDFVASRVGELDYLLSVCTGAAILAKSGVLNGKRATTNKGAWAQVTSFGTNISWVPSARWVVDGNVWTSSGVAAGLDMTYAFMKYLYGTEDLDPVMNSIEYAPHTNPHWDPFSVVHNVPGADKNMSLIDCVGPVGYS